LGGAPKIDRKQSIKAASDLAAASDVAVVVVGLNADWESEGFDRSTLTLPMDQDSLIKAVADANPNTIVVIQAVGYSVDHPLQS
jgi:beta-glucosidase